MLGFVPQPCKAVLLCRPSGMNRVPRPDPSSVPGAESVNPWYMTQTDALGNACGNIAVMHAVANTINAGLLSVDPESKLGAFLSATADSTPLERGTAFEGDEEVRSTHNSAASEGQSDQPSTQESVAAHFICFTAVDGILYELDGRKDGPIPLAAVTDETFLSEAAAAIKTYFMDPNPDVVGFSMIAFSLQQE